MSVGTRETRTIAAEMRVRMNSCLVMSFFMCGYGSDPAVVKGRRTSSRGTTTE